MIGRRRFAQFTALIADVGAVDPAQKHPYIKRAKP